MARTTAGIPFCLNREYRLYLFCLLGFLCLCTSLPAQEFNFIEYNVGDGLSQSEVISICEDRRGHLWLGTAGGGLNRFDGNDFKVFTKDDGMQSNSVSSILETRDGKLWLSYPDLGIGYFNGDKFTNFSGDQNDFDVGSTIRMVEDREGRLWISSRGGSLYQYKDGDFILYDTTSGLLNERIFGMVLRNDGKLWVGHETGYCIFNGTGFDSISTQHVPDGPNRLETAHFQFDGTAYFGANSTEIWKVKDEQYELIGNFPQLGTVNNLYVDQRGWIWVSGVWDVILIKNGKASSLHDQTALWDVGGEEIMEDKTGNLWLGTRGGGVFKFPGETFTHYNKGTPLYRNAVFSIVETEKGRFMIGTDQGVFEFKDNKFKEIKDDKGQSFFFARHIASSEEHGVYIRAAENKIYLLKNGRVKHLPFQDGSITSIYNINGEIYAGSNNGVYQIKGEDFKPMAEQDSAFFMPTSNMLLDKGGTWWLAHSVSGIRSIKDGVAHDYNTEDGLPHFYCAAFLEDKNNNIWVGTNEGLARFQDGQFCYLTSREGLIGNLIYCLTQDQNGNIWVGTEKGLSQIEIDANSDPGTIRNFGRDEGFIGVETNEGAYLAGSDGNLWFGTIYGMTKYNPKADRPNYSLPKVQIIDVKLNQEEVDWKKREDSVYSWYHIPYKPALSPTDNSFRFDFKAVALDYPGKIRYKYMLEGLNKTWSPPTSETQASYPVLPAGSYTFKVMAGRSDGAWSSDVATFEFTIPSHYYTTWWFRLGLLAMIAFVVFLIIRYRISSIDRQRLVLAQKVTERTRQVQEEKDKVEEANRVKSEFLAKMSHEIRTPMNGVIGMTDLLRRTSLTDQQRRFVDNIQISGKNLLNLINDILDFSRIESGKMELESVPLDIRRLTEEVLDILAYGAFNKNLELLYYVDPEIRGPVIGDPARLKQTMVNLVGNAIKFTETGQVAVEALVVEKDQEEAVIQICVKDSGIGIPAEKFQSLFDSFSQVDASTTRKYGGTGLGLAISYQLSKLMGGKMWVESKAGKGSSFYFTIRVGLSAPWQLPEGGHPARGLTGKQISIAIADPTAESYIERYLGHWGIHSNNYFSVEDFMDDLMKDPPHFAILDSRVIREETIQNANRLARLSEEFDFHYALLCEPGIAINLKSTLNERGRILNKPLKRDDLLNKLLLRNDTALEEKNLQVDQELALRIPLRILIAEDNPINMEVATGMLSSLGYDAAGAENGSLVLEKLKKESYDLIFMDVQMPIMDGLEATRRVISTYGDNRPLIVAMTANAMESDRQACLEAGMDTFISKPFVLDELVEMINSIQLLRGDVTNKADTHGVVSEQELSGNENLQIEQEPESLNPETKTEEKQAEINETEPVDEKEKNGAPSNGEDHDNGDTASKYKIIDLSMLYEAGGGESAFVMAIAGKLVAKLPEAMDELREHLGDQNWDQLRAIAHRTKSSAAYTGAPNLKEKFRELEHMARELEDLDQIPEKLEHLDSYVKEVVAELKIAVADLS